MLSSTPARVALIVVAVASVGCQSANTRPKAVPEPQVTAQDIEQNGSSTDAIAKAIQSRSSGVIVTSAPNGQIAVQIRGPATLYGSTEPLYVIDDIPVQAAPGGVLTGINPHDIESIRVLKNPEDTSVYGVRGGNGVIVIRMKKPGRK